jgi:hypothetical protein
MSRYAVINEATKVVENVIELTDGTWIPPLGSISVKSDEAKIGDGYDGGQFMTPPPSTALSARAQARADFASGDVAKKLELIGKALGFIEVELEE